MSRISRVIILPFAGSEAESDPRTANVCRGLAAFVDDYLGRLPRVETALQHLVISPDDENSSYRWLTVASRWSIEQVLDLPIPDSLGATHLLQGHVLWHEDSWEVGLQLVDLEARDAIWEGGLSCPPGEFIPRWMNLLATLATEGLGESSPAAARVLSPPTLSPEALEHYLIAVAQVSARRLRMPGISLAECLRGFLRTIRADPGFRDACSRLNGLAMHALFEDGSEQERGPALEAIAEARIAAPGFPLFGATLGMWHASRGDDERGLALLEEYVATEPDGEPLSRGLAVLGTIYRRLGRQQDAVRALAAAVERDATNLAGWEELAGAHLDAGRTTEAEECLRRVLDEDPERAGALVQLGGIYWGRGDLERAYRIFEQANEASAGFGEATRRLAAAALKLGRIGRADEIVTQWAEEHPGEAEPWLLLARIRREAGDREGVAFCLRHLRTLARDEGIAAAIQLEELAVTHPADHAAFMLVAGDGPRGEPAAGGESPAQREEILRALAARHGESLPIWMALSGHLLAMQQWGEAASAQARVVMLHPTSAVQWNTLGVLRSRSGSAREALLAFETAARLAPDSPSICTNLGLCLLELGDVVRAREYLTRAIALGEKSPAAALALLRIRALEREPMPGGDSSPSQEGALQRITAILDLVRKRMEG